MSANAYIMLNVEPVKTQAVLERLKALPGAVVHEVLGPYDIVVELESANIEELTSVLRSKIRTISGVTSTVTCTWLT